MIDLIVLFGAGMATIGCLALIGAFFVHAKAWLIITVTTLIVLWVTLWWGREHNAYVAKYGNTRPYNQAMRDVRGLACYVYGSLLCFHIVRLLSAITSEQWTAFWSLFFNL